MTSDTELSSRVEPIGTIGGYELLEVLSRSIVTTVYRGWQPSLNRPVLIKQLHPQLAAEKDIRARFEREARVIARVRQDNIVNIYDFSANPEAVFLVLEWVEGFNLSQILKRGGSLPAPIATLIIIEILKGLEVAHNQEVIHRDIKPENILVSKDGRIKISDFGLALFKDSPSITQQGMVIGTPSFMAPETITGGLVDARTDLFALGASFYELLTGDRVFSGTTFSESLHLVLSKQPDRPSLKVREIPPEIDRLVLKLLEKDTRKRYANAVELSKHLRSILLMYNWPDDPNLIKEYIADPAGFRLPKAARAPLRRNRSILTWGIVIILVSIVAILFQSSFKKFSRPQQTSQPDSAQTTIQTTDSVSGSRLDTSNHISKDSIPTSSVVVSFKNDKTDSALKRITDSVKTVLDNLQRRPVPEKHQKNNHSDTAQKRETNPSTVVQTGFLKVSSDPWSLVETNGIKVYLPTASPLSLSAGEHTLVFTNPRFPPITKKIVITANQTTQLNVLLWSEVGAVRIGHVSPWADIYINNVKVASTPIADPIPVQPGTVTIKFVNPRFPPRLIKLDLGQGQVSPRLDWDFENPAQ